ncbi:flavin-containing monooxygenase [Xanthobacteraceae bacterium A53D]
MTHPIKSERQTVRALLEDAHVVPMAMALVHLSGDLGPLEQIRPFIRDAWDYTAKVPDEVASALRDRLAEEIARIEGGGSPALPHPAPDLLRHMMSVAVGEEVPEDYVPMVLEHMGLADAPIPDPAPPALPVPLPEGFRVAIIGAGASGLCAAIQFARAGIPFTVFEKNDEVGGTWYENRYPGCAVDTPNHFYQFSFAPNNDWPNYYSRQPSILAYLKTCADRFGVRPHIRFGTEVVAADYDAGAHAWTLQYMDATGAAKRERFSVLMCAVGQLNRPAIPALPGLDTFEGETVHTATWGDTTAMAGKRVALIGTGASAVQVGPGIVDEVAALTVYQRSGSWVVRSPNIHRAVAEGKKWALDHVPFYAPWYRFQLFWGFADGLFQALRIDPEWQGGRGSISALNDRYRQSMLRHMQRELEGRDDLLAKVTPDYPPYGKRVLADAGWYRMLKRDHVALETAPIAAVEPRALRLADGRSIPTDAIVFATGFQAGKMLWPMEIRGRSGRSIRETWGDDDPRAFLGITVPDFPNLLVLYGPNTNLGHGGSAIFLAECQVRYCLSLLQDMIARNAQAFEVRRDTHDAYNERIDAELRQLVWSHPSVGTWYKNSSGRIITNQPWRLVDYWKLTHRAAPTDYDWAYAASTPPPASAHTGQRVSAG